MDFEKIKIVEKIPLDESLPQLFLSCSDNSKTNLINKLVKKWISEDEIPFESIYYFSSHSETSSYQKKRLMNIDPSFGNMNFFCLFGYVLQTNINEDFITQNKNLLSFEESCSTLYQVLSQFTGYHFIQNYGFDDCWNYLWWIKNEKITLKYLPRKFAQIHREYEQKIENHHGIDFCEILHQSINTPNDDSEVPERIILDCSILKPHTSSPPQNQHIYANYQIIFSVFNEIFPNFDNFVILINFQEINEWNRLGLSSFIHTLEETFEHVDTTFLNEKL